MGKKILPFAARGGAARLAHDRVQANVGLRSWLAEEELAALGARLSADDFTKLVD